MKIGEIGDIMGKRPVRCGNAESNGVPDFQHGD
jgi:hypothetical protein